MTWKIKFSESQCIPSEESYLTQILTIFKFKYDLQICGLRRWNNKFPFENNL